MKASTSMKLAAFCLLAALAVPCFAEEPAHITVFREKSAGNRFAAPLSHEVFMNRDWVHPRYEFQVHLDGTYVASLRPGYFMTFDLPAGRHEIRMKRSERIVLDLKPGERVYIHPGVHFTPYKDLVIPETIELASCQNVADYIGNQVLKPVKPKDIRFGEVAPEAAFPACADAK